MHSLFIFYLASALLSMSLVVRGSNDSVYPVLGSCTPCLKAYYVNRARADVATVAQELTAQVQEKYSQWNVDIPYTFLRINWCCATSIRNGVGYSFDAQYCVNCKYYPVCFSTCLFFYP
jgi:hypothetical protein